MNVKGENMKIFVAQLNPTIGDLEKNTQKIIDAIDRAKNKNADIVLFAELAICGYPPEDLLFYDDFIEKIEKKYLSKIIEKTENVFVVVGLVRKDESKKMFNSAAIIYDKELLGFKDKTLLPTYDVFDEKRYFHQGKEQKVWNYKNKKIGVLICEDCWKHYDANLKYLRDPVEEMKKLKPDLLLNLSASPYYFDKFKIREKVYQKTAKTLKIPVIICNQVGCNDQQVFDGYSMLFDENGQISAIAGGFDEDDLIIELNNEKPLQLQIDPIEDLYKALVLGVKDYFLKLGLTKACIGLSGGIDSAVVLCIAADALGSQNILVVNMPSRYSSKSGIVDAKEIADNLKVSFQTIDIDNTFQSMKDLLTPVFLGKKEDTTEENIQARLRGMLLMAISNKLNYILLSTGNKSEMAMGYCTLYGDMAGGLGVLVDVPKTLVYKIAIWINRNCKIIPKSIIEKAPSAELKENQKDQDDLPDYEIVDKVLEGFIEKYLSIDQIVKRYHIKQEIVEELVRKIHFAEYKRRQSPPGIRVSKKAFSIGRFFPIVHKYY